MARTLFVLNDVNDFAPGAFENTAVESGSIRLGRSGGIYLQSGCYTSPSFRLDPFLRLTASWNATTPRNTAVEVQARVASGGQWSRWFSFGKWSPFIDRASPVAQADAIACANAEFITLCEGRSPADMAQMRIYLYSDDPMSSPMVHLLSACVEPVQIERETASRAERILQLPVYSCLVRDPSIATSIATPTALTMLMNRWGEDALPEEVARASYDSGSQKFGNLAFISAIAGAYGYKCYAQFCGFELLRQEIRRGNAVGAHVHYRQPAVPSAPEKQSEKAVEEAPHTNLPVLEEAAATSKGHLVAVHGFFRKDNEEWVALNDPLANQDTEVNREMSLSQFSEIYTGLCIVLHKGSKGAGSARPNRLVGEISAFQGTLMLTAHNKEIWGKKGKIPPEEAALLTICYTLPDGTAYASAAQKKFYYLQVDEKGKIHFDRFALASKKTAFYFIGSRGETWVAEKTLE